tara:strand:- start:1205 stop:1387 length:183 start_codon:yes stop_codon:yes gene_type:complete
MGLVVHQSLQGYIKPVWNVKRQMILMPILGLLRPTPLFRRIEHIFSQSRLGLSVPFQTTE